MASLRGFELLTNASRDRRIHESEACPFAGVRGAYSLRVATSARRVACLDRFLTSLEFCDTVQTGRVPAGVAVKFVRLDVACVRRECFRGLRAGSCRVAYAAGPESLFDRLTNRVEPHRTVRTRVVPARRLVKDAAARVSMERLAGRRHACECDQDGEGQAASSDESTSIAHLSSRMVPSGSHVCRSVSSTRPAP